MAASLLGRRRARPVADAPVLERAQLAKDWAVELVTAAPLERATAVPGVRFAEDAPRLCAAVIAALVSDDALAQLEPGGKLAPLASGSAELAGARDALEALVALEALRAATWRALVEAAERPPPAMLAELADRLSAIVATLTAAAFEAGGPSWTLRPGDRGPLAAVLRGDDDDSDPVADADAEARSEVDGAGAAAVRLVTALDDSPEVRAAAERLMGEPGAPAAEPEAEAVPVGDPFDPRHDRRPLVEDASGFTARRVAPWTAAIERRVARHRTDGRPFGVFCVELVDADRLVASDRDGQVALALEAAEVAMCAQLRPADALVRERPGRYWLTTPDTGAAEASELARRIAEAIAAGAPQRGAALEAAVGVSSSPADGTGAMELEARAEERVFAARAAGIRVASPDAG